MPPHPGPALRKVTLNLFEEDCTFLEQYTTEGWTTLVREWVHEASVRLQAKLASKPKTLGDINEPNI